MKLVEHETHMCSLMQPYVLRGIYIGSVITMRGNTLLIVEQQNGQIFVGVKGSVAVITEAPNAPQEKRNSPEGHG
jgi:hypothetical protein